MNAYDFVQLTFLALGGKIQGKTKLQKTVYFLGIMTGELDNLGYGPHFYGPYSSEVADATGQLHALGFLDRNTVQASTCGGSGFEAIRYDFALNSAGTQIAKAKAATYPDIWKKLEEAAQKLKKPGDIDYMKMSIAAKAYFMLGEKKGRASTEELAALAPKFGWTVTEEQVAAAVDYLKKLGMVKEGSKAR